MIEFAYTNEVPPVARPGTNTNAIRLWRENGQLVYDRRYISSNGTVSATAIEHRFEGKPSPEEVAKMIHWGCCGWAAGSHQIWQLIEKIRDFVTAA